MIHVDNVSVSVLYYFFSPRRQKLIMFSFCLSSQSDDEWCFRQYLFKAEYKTKKQNRSAVYSVLESCVPLGCVALYVIYLFIRALHHHLIKSKYGSVVGAKDDTAEENEFFQELKDFSGHCLLQEINTSLDDYKMTTQTLHNAITFVQ